MARLFLSTDDNAPVIAGSDRACLVNLLKKCLIEGYGGKAPVGGWTMPYSTTDGRVGVFRNDHENGGLGHYLRVAQENDNSSLVQVKAYENMTGANEGVFPYGDGFTARSSYSSAGVIRPWVFLASKTWLALFVYFDGTEYPSVNQIDSRWGTEGFWFGDIDRAVADDNYHGMLSPISSQNEGIGTLRNDSSLTYSSSTAYRFPRKSDGVPGGPTGHLCYLPHPLISPSLGFGAQGPPYGATTGLLVARAALNDGAAYTLRGWIPDMLVPLHPRPFEHLERVEIGGKPHVAVCFAKGQYWGSWQYVSMNACQALFELDPGE